MTKGEQRALALQARRALSPEQRQQYSEHICRRLLELPALRSARLVLSYRALEDEVDLSLLHTALADRGVRLAFPRSLPGGILDVREPAGWTRGPFGIREPDPACSSPVAPDELELVLAPCVAFDEGCRRLGHGAGYYDRYFPRCPQAQLIAVAFEAQKLPAIAVDAYDQPMDLVVTEDAVYKRR